MKLIFCQGPSFLRSWKHRRGSQRWPYLEILLRIRKDIVIFAKNAPTKPLHSWTHCRICVGQSLSGLPILFLLHVRIGSSAFVKRSQDINCIRVTGFVFAKRNNYHRPNCFFMIAGPSSRSQSTPAPAKHMPTLYMLRMVQNSPDPFGTLSNYTDNSINIIRTYSRSQNI